MKQFLLCSVLLLVLPMALLNPLGRTAFLSYYAGVIATCTAYVIAVRFSERRTNVEIGGN